MLCVDCFIENITQGQFFEQSFAHPSGFSSYFIMDSIARLVLKSGFSRILQSRSAFLKHFPSGNSARNFSWSSSRSQAFVYRFGGKQSRNDGTNWLFFNSTKRGPLRFLLYCGIAEAVALIPPVLTEEEKLRKEQKEDMITDIKRGILFLRDGEFRKAEDILHIALGKARDMQEPQGEVYILDLLANLYYEERKYDKAEATFKEVLRRELAAGKPEDTEAIVEISAKLARMYAETRQFDKARAGFDFCLEKLEKKLESLSEDKKEEVVDLFFKVLQWGSEFLLNVEDRADDALVEATELIESGLKKARRLEQTSSSAYQTLSNNLSTLYTWQNRMDEAVSVMKETIKLAIASQHWSLSHFYLNLAHIYAENGDLKNANLTAEKAMEVAKKTKDPAVEAEVKRLQESLKKQLLERK